MINSDVAQEALKGSGPKSTSKKGSLFTNAFIYLYLNGYCPALRIHQNKISTSMPWEEASEHLISSLERFEPCSATAKKKVREYFKSSAVDGIFKESHTVYSGMMTWNMKNRAVKVAGGRN